ncbi:hypothetical protein F4861DRAFT_543120 [Xylaria intraflava]|nr:hypothetical protein F4861DRAFT_543120 [Xylaria intraflava]
MFSYRRFDYKGSATLPLTPTIENQAWHITGTERAEYIEVSSPPKCGANDPDAIASSCRHGTLVDNEVLDWVLQRGRYLSRLNQDTGNESQARIRLLVLERSYYQPPSFDIRKATYLAIEKHFALPEDTLLTLSSEGGMSTHTVDIDEATGTLKRLSMAIKTHQKVQVGNYGLAFSYDFATGVSTGILHGTGVTQHGRDCELWDKEVVVEIFEHIKAAHRLWGHPLCLPATLLQHHLLRTDYFCTVVLPNRFLDAENQLGAVRAGRLLGVKARNIAAELPVQQAKVSLAELTVVTEVAPHRVDSTDHTVCTVST